MKDELAELRQEVELKDKTITEIMMMLEAAHRRLEPAEGTE